MVSRTPSECGGYAFHEPRLFEPGLGSQGPFRPDAGANMLGSTVEFLLRFEYSFKQLISRGNEPFALP